MIYGKHLILTIILSSWSMNITSQALSDHVKAALKKIGDNLARI